VVTDKAAIFIKQTAAAGAGEMGALVWMYWPPSTVPDWKQGLRQSEFQTPGRADAYTRCPTFKVRVVPSWAAVA